MPICRTHTNAIIVEFHCGNIYVERFETNLSVFMIFNQADNTTNLLVGLIHMASCVVPAFQMHHVIPTMTLDFDNLFVTAIVCHGLYAPSPEFRASSMLRL